jgi:hypothetical protein
MPNVVYTSRHAVNTLAAKRIAYERLVTLIQHLEAFDVDLVALSLNADRTVSVTLTGPIPLAQLEHVGLR